MAGPTSFIDEVRIEIDSNVVELSILPIALNRKNTLFAGIDGGGEHWAIIASLIEICKLNDIDPQRYLNDVLTRIVNDHPNGRIVTCCLRESRQACARERGLTTTLTDLSMPRHLIAGLVQKSTSISAKPLAIFPILESFGWREGDLAYGREASPSRVLRGREAYS